MSRSITLPQARQTASAQAVKLSPVLALLVVSILLIPFEASLFIGTLRVPVARLILLAATPVAIVRYCSSLGSAAYKFVWADLLVPLTGVWMVVSVCMTDGQERGFVGAGAIALEFVGTYFVTRMWLKRPGEAVKLGRLVAVLIAVDAILAVPDTFQQSFVVHTVVGSLTGFVFNNGGDIRNGHFRAAGVMEHPILLGTACSFGMLLSWQLCRGVFRAILLVLQIIGLIVSVSSAPILGLVIGFGCIFYRRLTPDLDSRWQLLLGSGLFCVVLVFVLASDPLGFLIRHLTFDPQTGYYRLLEWDTAGGLVMASPWLGIGLTDDWLRPNWMPSTVDSVWLRSAMEFGIPGSLMVACSVLGACSRPVDRSSATLSTQDKLLGVALSIILSLYVFEGFTVHFWGATWMLLGLFMGMRAHLGVLASQRVRRSKQSFFEKKDQKTFVP